MTPVPEALLAGPIFGPLGAIKCDLSDFYCDIVVGARWTGLNFSETALV